MLTHYRLGSIIWLAVGIYAAISAYRLGFGSFTQPGPGFIFVLMALLLMVLSAIDLGATLIRKEKAGEENPDDILWSGVRWQKVLLLIVGLSVYISVFNFLGFLFSTFLLMLFLFKVDEPTRWWVAILESFITILFSYGLFGLWLKVSFPQGILGF